MTSPERQMTIREVLRLRAVRPLWLAQVVSVFGDFLALFAVFSYASFRLGASATQVTRISVAYIIPLAFIGPVAGVFVDRWNVKRTMIASDLIRAALALGLVFCHTLGQIYAVLFLLSVASAFFIPAQTVTLRALFPPEALLAANTLLQQAIQIMRIVSPALAGALVGSFGAASCYYLDSLTFFFSALMIAMLTITHEIKPAAKGSHPLKSVLNELFEGGKFIFTHAIISFVIMAMAAGVFAISCFGPLIAVYVRDELHATALAYGMINALIGVGMVAGTWLIGRVAQRLSQSHLMLAGLLTMGASVAVLGGFKSIPSASISMFGVGVGFVFIFVSAQTLMQGQTPIELIGRVSSSLLSVISIAQMIGLVFSGPLAQALGIRNLFYASAIMLLLMTVSGYLRIPKELTIRAGVTEQQPAD